MIFSSWFFLSNWKYNITQKSVPTTNERTIISENRYLQENFQTFKTRMGSKWEDFIQRAAAAAGNWWTHSRAVLWCHKKSQDFSKNSCDKKFHKEVHEELFKSTSYFQHNQTKHCLLSSKSYLLCNNFSGQKNQICLLVFWENLQLDNLVSILSDL